MSETVALALGVLAGYFLGAIPASYLIAKWGFGVDLRTIGSGNVGATNALRALGPKAGVPALLCDSLKGTAAVVLAGHLLPGGGPLGPLGFPLVCGVAAILGHSYTFWLGFKGGKGVATGAGVFGALAPVPLGLALVVWLLVVVATRIVSLASILAALSLPIWIVLFTRDRATALVPVALPVALFIAYRHRENLKRMAAGTEPKISFGGAKPEGQQP
jgi:glycerol-3-phosphate acyltransferase PlsY